jgi:SAM-dependent methyltransferase
MNRSKAGLTMADPKPRNSLASTEIVRPAKPHDRSAALAGGGHACQDATIDWREGNVLSLPVAANESFTVLTCHQGLQFFPDKIGAAREIRRVLSPGGRVALATWRSLRDLPVARELNDIAERHVGTIVDMRHSFGEASALEALLVEAGLREVHVETISHDVRFADGALFARLNAMAVIGMSERGRGMTEAERAQVADRIAINAQELISRQTRNGAFVFPLATHVATARA